MFSMREFPASFNVALPNFTYPPLTPFTKTMAQRWIMWVRLNYQLCREAQSPEFSPGTVDGDYESTTRR
jgi:hypothetical protein